MVQYHTLASVPDHHLQNIFRDIVELQTSHLFMVPMKLVSLLCMVSLPSVELAELSSLQLPKKFGW